MAVHHPLSHTLLGYLGVVRQFWIYTTWTTACVDPQRLSVREMRDEAIHASFERIVAWTAVNSTVMVNEAATGRFQARQFVRDDTWLVAVSYQPSDVADPSAAAPA